MTAAPLQTTRRPQRMVAHSGGRDRVPPSARGIARRRFLVTWSKLLLPAAALALLASIALWPEFEREAAAGRSAYRRLMSAIDSGKLIDARYKGVDEKGRPYAMTAVEAVQATPERVNLTTPKADMLLESGAWLMVNAVDGVYMQHAGLLDLSGDVTLYRDDGTTMHTPSAAIDLKTGAAMGSETVTAEGPFGTLDAMGFALVDKGAVIQFTGPARLVLNGSSK